jgi:hypothetical protein
VSKSRKVIRKKIIELLKGQTDAEDRVFPNASIPPWSKDLPAILVFNRLEDAEEWAKAPRELKRMVDFSVEITAAGSDEHELLPPNVNSLSDILDDIAQQVEDVFEKDETLGGTADDSILTSTQFDVEGSGEQPIGSARLVFRVTYYRAAPDSIDKQGITDDFNKANAKYEIGHHDSAPDGVTDAEDNVDISP